MSYTIIIEVSCNFLSIKKVLFQADRERQKQAKLGNDTPAFAAPVVAPAPAHPTPSLPAKDYDSTKIQVRLPDGKALVQVAKNYLAF